MAYEAEQLEHGEERLLTTKQTADILGCKPNTLAKARVYKGPLSIPHVKCGPKLVRYSTRDVAAFIRARTAITTVEHDSLA